MSLKTTKKRKHFIPLQPEFEHHTQCYIEHRDYDLHIQSPLLFYSFRTKQKQDNVISAVPDACIDLLFYSDKNNYRADICGSVLQRKQILFLPETTYLGVRFLPKHGFKNTDCAVKELIEQEVPLKDIINNYSPAIENIISENTLEKKIFLTKKFLNNTFFTESQTSNLVIYLLDRIYETAGNISMKTLGTETGYSTRYIRKKFEEQTGLSPKLFCRITRFQSSLYMLRGSLFPDVSDVISRKGFYDQAHFNNEFKSFGLASPLKYLEGLQQSR